MNFTFDGNISREVLENYLSRSVTAAGLYESKTLEDDLRAIREMGVKFLGRASGIWYMTMDDEEHFRLSKELADKVHAQDPEMILQSCVFEWITRRMETVEIPDYVFEAFGMEPEHRCFAWMMRCLQTNPADLPAGERIRQKTGGFRICPGRKQDCGFITGQPDTSTVAMRYSIWGRCTCIPRTIKEWQKQQNCSV